MLAFPLAMPDELRIESVTFAAIAPAEDTPSTEAGGTIYAKDLGPAIWRASWQTGVLLPAEHGIVRGWLDALGGTNPFWAYDALRPYPRAHPFGFGALGWSGGATLAGVSSSRVITVTGVPAGLVISAGDYVAFDTGAGPVRALHRAVAAAVPAGGTIAIEVRPYVSPGWIAGASVTFARPAVKMVVQTKSIQETVSPNGTARLSFSAIESR